MWLCYVTLRTLSAASRRRTLNSVLIVRFDKRVINSTCSCSANVLPFHVCLVSCLVRDARMRNAGLQETHLEAAKIALPLLLTHTSAILTALVAADDAVTHEEASTTFQNLPIPSRTKPFEPDYPSHQSRTSATGSPRSARHSTALGKADRGLAQGGVGSGKEGAQGGRVWTWQRARGVSSVEYSGMEGSSDFLVAAKQRSASMHAANADASSSLGLNRDSAEGAVGDRTAGKGHTWSSLFEFASSVYLIVLYSNRQGSIQYKNEAAAQKVMAWSCTNLHLHVFTGVFFAST